jgi:glycosyltransferase involved in cell wall biosynthesis
MKIAIDLSVLQTGHRMRGVGAVLINFINFLPESEKKEHEFIFFLNEDGAKDALSILKLDGIAFTVEYLQPRKTLKLKLPGKLNLFVKGLNALSGMLEFYTGDSRIPTEKLKDIDRFIQFDQSQRLPKGSSRHTSLVLYDIIPYVMEKDYLLSYSTARSRGRRRRSALKHAFHRWQYITRLRINCRRAKHLLAISEYTKKDFITYADANKNKISVCYLGADSSALVKPSKNLEFKAYKTTSWGPSPQPVDLNEKPFLLFMGGVDQRRKLIELLAAFNNLQARGVDIALVLAGDTLYGATEVPNGEVQTYLKHNASYLDNTHFLGYVSDEQRAWLYEHALAYVYPSVYEGFGLPVLEAMQHGTPVITYNNTSIAEVAGSAALFAANFQDIADQTMKLLHDSKLSASLAKKGTRQVSQFTWSSTSSAIMEIVKS